MCCDGLCVARCRFCHRFDALSHNPSKSPKAGHFKHDCTDDKGDKGGVLLKMLNKKIHPVNDEFDQWITRPFRCARWASFSLLFRILLPSSLCSTPWQPEDEAAGAVSQFRLRAARRRRGAAIDGAVRRAWSPPPVCALWP